MRRKTVIAAALLCLLASLNALTQSTNATVGGTVQDSTGAFIPGVSVTARNTGTGIVTTIVSNEAGAYQFASLQPGFYEIKAELPGFQTAVAKDFQLGGAQQARLNFTLQVAAAAGTTIDVAVAADTLLATSSNSIGTILPEYKLRDLPLASRDVFGLISGQAGAQESGGLMGAFAGTRISAANTTRDGMNVSAGRFEDGAWSLTYTSPDLVEEVKVVVAPVDAQTSRGNGQVSMVTRSGTNQYRGSVFWANHNSALDASTWFNNFNGVAKNYDNRNQYGGRIGGPIIKNKTFFFLLFEGQRDLKRENATGNTLTAMARQGIFRYFPGADNTNANNANPAVDRAGNPVRPSGANIGDLSAIDLFGNCTFQGAPVPNCRTYIDPLRRSISNTTYIQETLRRMPLPNEFTGGDGLNQATIRFTRRVDGLDFTLGNGPDVNRNQYNIRIDHNFDSKNKLSFIGTKEKTWGNATQAILRSWPEGFDGVAVKLPDVYILSFTSTLSSTLLNELRVGRRRSIDQQFPPANRPGPLGEEALKYIPFANGVPFHAIPALWTPFVQYGRFGAWRNHNSPMHSIGDDLSWTRGKHAFKGGVEFRNTMSKGFGDPGFTPFATFGQGSNPIAGLDGQAFQGLTGNNATNAQRLLTDLTASVGTINQSFGIMSSKDLKLTSSPAMPYKYYQMHQREFSLYFKDDWKFRSDLTLNLGVHWEYYGQPFEKNGLAARIVGDDISAFTKLSCPSSPGTAGFNTTCSNLTQVQFVGKNSPNPDKSVNLKDNDSNNWAPAVGLAWSVPWFGKDKTVVRVGYGITFQGALRNFITVDNTVGTVPGINLVGSGGAGVQYTPPSYTSLSNMTLPIPKPAGTPETVPFVIPTTDRTITISTYDRLSPYTQNWNLEIQREVARNTTIELRYIGTKGTKLWGTINLNQIDALTRNRAMFDAFVAARNGQESALLNQMLMGINLGGTGAATVNGTTWTGAMAVRANTVTRTQLANGSVGAFLNTLNTLTTGTGSASNGAVLRRNGFAENYVTANPQFGGISVLTNPGSSTYHSMQLQFQRRLTNGFTNLTSWTWSKALGESDGDGGATYRDPTRRSIEKSLLGFDRAHQITSSGTYELPFGSGHRILGNAPGWVQHIVNRWQLGAGLNFNSGAPLTITATGTQTISNVSVLPNIVGELPKNMGKITRVSNGVVFFDGFTQPQDPGISTVTGTNGLNTAFTNRAIADPSGKIVLVNPQPGDVGTLGLTTLKGPTSLSFDTNLIKRFRIHETKEFEFRVDAINVLNRPNWGNPSTNINGVNTFGRITTATGSRRFIINTRLNF